jgi:hypothetical protein
MAGFIWLNTLYGRMCHWKHPYRARRTGCCGVIAASLSAASWKGLGVTATPFADDDQDQFPATIAEAPE